MTDAAPGPYGYDIVISETNEQLDDAFGHFLRDWQDGMPVTEVVERDDGLILPEHGGVRYFAPLRRWPAHERDAIALCRGRVLDIGCGSGRVALHVQEHGHEVIAIDSSPLAIDVARERGVSDARVVRLSAVGPCLGQFGTFLFFGNGFGLLEGGRRAEEGLRRLSAIADPGARILAGSRDVTRTNDPIDLAYQAKNRARQRLPGHLRVRIRYRHYATPWFEHLMASRDDMAAIASTAGWRLADVIGDGDDYVGVLERSSGVT